jgi:hypothetical protein
LGKKYPWLETQTINPAEPGNQWTAFEYEKEITHKGVGTYTPPYVGTMTTPCRLQLSSYKLNKWLISECIQDVVLIKTFHNIIISFN